jgi:hypothetical protein
MSTFEQTETPVNRRFLNVKLGDITTDIDLKDIISLGQTQDAIKAKFSHTLATTDTARIYLELDDGEALKDLEDIPSEYFLKRKDPKSKTLEIKVRSPPPAHGVIPEKSNFFLNALFFQKRLANWQFTHSLLRIE